jgi:hypothetical protein
MDSSATFMLPLAALDDIEGDNIPESFPEVIDAHVHVFPDQIFAAIWQWFDKFAWPIRYRLSADRVIEHLSLRGVSRVVLLHYAHKPGIATSLNRFVADLCRRHPRAVGLATVFPGEEGAADILRKAFAGGLQGVKLHAHVQFFDMESDAMAEVYEVCRQEDKPLVMHVGREPKNPSFPYPRDPYEICGAAAVERVLRAFPAVRICVPHLGADEFEPFARLIEQYDNLWLDTAMTLADYLPGTKIPDLRDLRADRIMYGTDFPNIPYAWDREIRIPKWDLSEDDLALILGGNARAFFSITS